MKRFTEYSFFWNLNEGLFFYTGAVQFINIYNYNELKPKKAVLFVCMCKQCKATVLNSM